MQQYTLPLFIVGLIFITKGADWFTESAVSISQKSGIPKMIIGATIVSFATTAPEFAVSAYAAYLGHTGLTVGNAVGSAICNAGLILGGVIVLRSIPVEDSSFLKRGAFMIVSALLLIVVSIDGMLTPVDGILLLVVFVVFLYYNYRLQSLLFGTNEEVNEELGEISNSISKDVVFFVLGAALVVGGSRILIDSGTDIAMWLGVPEMIIGLTLVAFGTSLPELITAISATRKGHNDLAVGNILGANTMDIALILGASSLISELPIQNQSLYYDFPAMLLIMGMIVFFGLTGRKLARWEGAVILATYIAYVGGLFFFYMQ
ncbi:MULTISPECIES: calcium/sodium antiporter [Methanohalophilus]|jgi:cation:H+ antiporter|uniref:Calcium/sodium antiporter n=1 Tax=Methanohalophilus euhalobius TaxID=51203 RepID=A0A285EK93_9EURY|nr:MULTISPECIES: calcium/sodium antiporter [Methanohalophilus]KXS46305.1 MAG: inner membrane protein [Methanohalophilus sp. T328-1]OBZ36057.1 MAG: sodium:proton exchanger [Methanohalophilus sp. DAL1]ODV49156.1 MAG: inner membrane protein [Methanohalophilus sp. 2-GBenrich]PQV43471.1 cation:H+ antiporter [Methanohalophilus euhalobius]RNI07370.1 calcium/sodium antiporter [Methanohalophilus euhalobius]